jgi:hypothetical protein
LRAARAAEGEVQQIRVNWFRDATEGVLPRDDGDRLLDQ